MIYDTLESLVVDAFQAMRPKENLTVTEAAEKYHIIRQPGAHSGPWSARKTPYMVEVQDTLTSLDYTGVAFVGPARTGKALALDTPIPTPRGWSNMGDIQLLDEVYDENGKICTVISTTDVMFGHDCYRVTFSNGDSIVADGEHQWTVGDMHRPDRMHLMTTEEMYPTHLYGKTKRTRYYVPMGKALEGYENENLHVEPYLLGLWLGDGTTGASSLTINANDVDDIREALGDSVSDFRSTSKKGNSYTVRPYADRNWAREGMNEVRAALQKYGMGFPKTEKFIPVEYLRSSLEQRKSLLRGLLDTDGHADKRGGVEFCTTSKGIADGFGELLVSLGYKYCLTTKPAASKIAYRFLFYPRLGDVVFSVSRKQARLDARKDERTVRIDRVYIISIEPVESVPVKCIGVDSPSNLYRAGRKMTVTHNSASALNWIAQTAICDPADMLVVHMTQNDARKWSKDDLAKMFRHSPTLRDLLRPGRINDNTYDKEFLSGMRLTIVWPTANNLSGVTVSRVALLDYDRMPDDVDGEGTPFDLAKKRTTTFKRFGMTYVESSPNPNKEIEDPKWMPKTPHQAPPIRGIFEIYNRGDRRKWYWSCPKCKEAFEPDFQHLHYPATEDIYEAGESVIMRCPSCQFEMPPAMKEELNLGGRWVRDGMMLLPSGEIVQRPDSRPLRSDIASFWLKGPAAGYQEWKSLVIDYLRAEQAYIETGDEAPLKKAVTADQGNYYISKARLSDRKPEDLKQKAENWGTSKEDPTVPWGVRFLTATVDVQARSFVVQINGFAENGDLFVIDGFKIRSSERLDEDGKNLPLSPFSVAEDWHLLTDQVVRRSYPLADGSGRRMKIFATFCDSGGGEGATHNAYNYWRDLRKGGEGLHRKFALVKGAPSLTLPRASVSWPDSKQTGRKASARGDVPVILMNSNLLKDMVAAMMQRRLDEREVESQDRGGMLRYPDWQDDWFYKQLTNEIRTGKGWENPAKRRNEVFDLTYYAIGGAVRPNDPTAPFVNIQIERINWDNPPTWASEWDENDQVFGGRMAQMEVQSEESSDSRGDKLRKLGAKLAGLE